MSTRIENDEALVALLRSTLDEVEADPDGWPHTMPPWERINAGMRTARRGRRWRTARRTAAGLLAVTAAAAGVMTGVVPYPGFAPTVTMPGSAGHSSMYDRPTRGNLAQQGEWLAQFRQVVAGEIPSREPDGGLWEPPPADKVKVLYAADVGAYRVALVEGDWHWGPIADPQQVWYFGEAGAPAADMEKGGNHEPGESDGVMVSPSNLLSGSDGSDTTAAAVVVSAVPVEVVVQGSPVISADGKASTDERRVAAAGDGSYATELHSPGLYRLLVDGTVFDGDVELGEGGWSAPSSYTPLRDDLSLLQEDGIDGLLADTAASASQVQTAHSSRVLAAAPFGKWPQVMVALEKVRSGAYVIGGGALTHDGEWGLDAGAVLPAGPVEELAFAWRSGADWGPGVKPWTAAVGPVGTATVEWVRAGGAVTSSAAQHTLATTSAQDVESVRFLDAGGHRLATAKVTAPLPPDDMTLPEVKGR